MMQLLFFSVLHRTDFYQRLTTYKNNNNQDSDKNLLYSKPKVNIFFSTNAFWRKQPTFQCGYLDTSAISILLAIFIFRVFFHRVKIRNPFFSPTLIITNIFFQRTKLFL